MSMVHRFSALLVLARWAVVVLASTILMGCGLAPQRVPFDDPQVQELLRAMDTASLYRFGFTPVSADADIRLERSSGAYDLMLHVDGRTSRTIAFRLEGEDSVWIGEQEIYKGPGEYTTVDGTFFEQISLTYELQRVSGHRLNHLNITYSGEDPRLAGRNDLRLQEVVPILREWGYDVERIGGVRQSRVSSR